MRSFGPTGLTLTSVITVMILSQAMSLPSTSTNPFILDTNSRLVSEPMNLSGVLIRLSIAIGSSPEIGDLQVPFNRQVLENIGVDWISGIRRGFQPTQLYYNVYITMIEHWKSSTNRAITQTENTNTPRYQNLVTSIVPAPGSGLLTEAVAAAILFEMLKKITSVTAPTLWTASLATKGSSPDTIGLIQIRQSPSLSAVMSSNISDISTIDSGLDMGNNNTSTTISNEGTHITASVSFKGQSPFGASISPQAWLTNFYAANLFFFPHAYTDAIRYIPGTAIAYVRSRLPGQAPFTTKVSPRAPPRGRSGVLTWGDLVSGMMIVLDTVTARGLYEQVEASIWKDDWLAATFSVVGGAPSVDEMTPVEDS